MTDRRTQIPHADHCGSLLRPQELRSARAAHALGRMGDDELRGIEDKAILRAFELQRQVGSGSIAMASSAGSFSTRHWKARPKGSPMRAPISNAFPYCVLPISPPIRRSRPSTPSSRASCVRVDASRRMR